MNAVIDDRWTNWRAQSPMLVKCIQLVRSVWARYSSKIKSRAACVPVLNSTSLAPLKSPSPNNLSNLSDRAFSSSDKGGVLGALTAVWSCLRNESGRLSINLSDSVLYESANAATGRITVAVGGTPFL